MLPLGVPGLAARAAGGGADPFQGAGGAAAGLGAAAEAGLQVRRGQGGAVAKRGTRRTPQKDVKQQTQKTCFFFVGSFFFWKPIQKKLPSVCSRHFFLELLSPLLWVGNRTQWKMMNVGVCPILRQTHIMPFFGEFENRLAWTDGDMK